MKLVLKADRLIDGTGAEPVQKAALVVEGGEIAQVTTQDRLELGQREEVQVIEVPGGTIMPGFVEVHSHIHCSATADAFDRINRESDETLLMRGVQAVREALLSGVTTMRDLGSKNQVVFPLKAAIEEGIIPGPRFLVAGTPITTTGGHCYMFGTEADTAEEVVKALRRQVKLGARWIKIMSTGGAFTPGTNVRAPQYPAETLRAAVEDAERLGVRVAAHCHATAGVRNCVEAGIHNLIHCTWLSSNPEEGFDYDPALADRIAEKGLYVDPTIATGYMRRWRDPSWDPSRRAMAFIDPERRYEILRDMWERGVKFVSGLDSGMAYVYFGDFAYTPQLLVEKLEIPSMEAILICTRNSAECLGVLDETGTLEPGKVADVIVVQGDPLADINALHKVDTVVRAGRVVKAYGTPLV